MSLVSLSRSLKKFVANSKNFTKAKFAQTKEHLKAFDFLSKDAAWTDSEKITKKIAYKCNHNYHKDHGARLGTAQEILESWIKSAKLYNIKPSESIVKILIITYINQSIVLQGKKPAKSIETITKAIKLTENFRMRTYKGKLLKFIAKLHQCELFIYVKKYDLAIMSAQQVLKEVMKKLQKPKTSQKALEELGMAAVTAFYRIGICEQSKGMHKAAESAFENADTIGRKYLNKNEVLLSLDYEKITHRKFRTNETLKRESIRKIAEIRRIEGEKKKSVKFSELPSEIQKPEPMSERRSNSMVFVEEKLPGRYYSNRELERLTKILNTEINHKNLTADNYFFHVVSKQLAIEKLETSPESVKNSTIELLHEIWKNKEVLKKKKKTFEKKDKCEMPADLERKIFAIQAEFEDSLKIQDIKMKSKLKTKVYRQLLRSINLPSNRKVKNTPIQRLFFRPPEKGKQLTVNTFKKVDVPVSKPLSTSRLEEINHDIGDQIEELVNEMKGNQSSCKSLLSPLAAVSELARSTIRIKKPTISIKKSVSKSFIGQTSQRLSKKRTK